MYKSYNKQFGSKITFAIIELLTVLICLFSILYLPVEISALLPIVYASSIFVFALEKGSFSRYLSNQYLKKLGHLSYSIFITHMLIISLLEGVVKRFSIDSIPIQIIALGLYLLIVYKVASFTNIHIELKISQAIKKKSIKKKLISKSLESEFV
ncbi:hypothetical protein [Spirosoma pomorum]